MAVSRWGIAPSEFWAMTPDEFFLILDDRMGEPKIAGMPAADFKRLRGLLERSMPKK